MSVEFDRTTEIYFIYYNGGSYHAEYSIYVDGSNQLEFYKEGSLIYESELVNELSNYFYNNK